MSRVLIVFNSPNGSDAQDWQTLMNGTESKEINGDVVYVLTGSVYREEGEWKYQDIVSKVNAIMTAYNDSKFAVLLHTQNINDITELSLKINNTNVAIQRFSTAVSPIINYEAYIRPFCSNGNQENFNNLWAQIQKKSPDTLPHLIALSILCQGYLAAHEGEGLVGWDKVPPDIKRKVAEKIKDPDPTKNPTKKQWWNSALGDDKSKIQDELNAVPDKDESKSSVQKLITAIYTGDDDTPIAVEFVRKAYSALKLILQGE